MFLNFIHPYEKIGLLSFFKVLLSRVLDGSVLDLNNLVIDEIQILLFVGLAISGAILGSFCVLKKITMLADVISHTALLGLVCVVIFSKVAFVTVTSLFIASVFTAILTTFLIRILKDLFFIKEEEGTAFVFSFLFSLSLVLLSLYAKHTHLSIDLITGNSDILDLKDVKLIWFVMLTNIVFCILCFKSLVYGTFDTVFSFSIGLSQKLLNYMFMFQLSYSLMASFKSVGIVMSLAFLVLPSLIARKFSSSVKNMIFNSVVIGIVISVFGIACSRYILNKYNIGLSTGALIVLFLFIFYLCSQGYLFFRQKIIHLKSNKAKNISKFGMTKCQD